MQFEYDFWNNDIFINKIKYKYIINLISINNIMPKEICMTLIYWLDNRKLTFKPFLSIYIYRIENWIIAPQLNPNANAWLPQLLAKNNIENIKVMFVENEAMPGNKNALSACIIPFNMGNTLPNKKKIRRIRNKTIEL